MTAVEALARRVAPSSSRSRRSSSGTARGASRCSSRSSRAAARPGALVLLDVKRGDIGSTVQAYADAYLDPTSPLAADAITASPYLGVGSLDPLIDTALANGAGRVRARADLQPGGPAGAARPSPRTAAPSPRRARRGSPRRNAGRRRRSGSFGAVVGATIDRRPTSAGGPRRQRPAAGARHRRPGRHRRRRTPHLRPGLPRTCCPAAPARSWPPARTRRASTTPSGAQKPSRRLALADRLRLARWELPAEADAEERAGSDADPSATPKRKPSLQRTCRVVPAQQGAVRAGQGRGEHCPSRYAMAASEQPVPGAQRPAVRVPAVRPDPARALPAGLRRRRRGAARRGRGDRLADRRADVREHRRGRWSAPGGR